MSQPSTSVPPPPVDFSALVRAEETLDYQAGDVIIAEGEPGDSMYVLLEGTVVVSCEGRDIINLGPGNIFGEMSVIKEESVRSATVRARDAVRVVAITRRRFLFLTQQTPYFALHVMQMLSDRIRRMNHFT